MEWGDVTEKSKRRVPESKVWQVSSYSFTAPVEKVEIVGGEMEGVGVPEESTYSGFVSLERESKFQESGATIPDFEALAVIDLTDVNYVWVDLKDVDYFNKIDLLNRQLTIKEKAIKDLEIQVEEYKNELEKYKRENSRTEKIKHVIKSQGIIIKNLRKDINLYKEKLDRFTIDFSLPEGYYGDEEFNE